MKECRKGLLGADTDAFKSVPSLGLLRADKLTPAQRARVATDRADLPSGSEGLG